MSYAHNFNDLGGQVFGCLTVEAETDGRHSGHVLWRCRCECGAEAAWLAEKLRRLPKCWHRPFWSIAGSRCWDAMIHRCYNPKHINYPSYGGRGITVCDRWRASFHDFIADMGPRPSARHSIDRWPDQQGNYEPGNCRWATPPEQSRNRTDNVSVEYQGETVLVVDLAARLGLNYAALRGRLRMGWGLERAITQPVRRYASFAAIFGPVMEKSP